MSGISFRQIDGHWTLYEALCERANDLRDDLVRGDTPHRLLAVRRELAGVLNEVKQHAIYFSNLGGGGGEPPGVFGELIRRDFGDFAAWARDFKSAASVASGWVTALVDQDDGHVYNLADAVWEGSPVLALDVAEHAYALDHGLGRTTYVEAFFANVDWSDVNARADRALRRLQA
jgi:Fe-Mn family superoxide dismutase